MGSSIIENPRSRALASTSTSKANPSRRLVENRSLATGEWNSLNPHWVSVMGPLRGDAMVRKARLPSRRMVPWGTS